jgi:aspartyl-tRNA(Asn)/glutamyl-tRNA(Gln) amidotransferase subunit A
MPLSWSLDHMGPLTRTVADAATVLGIIAGYDPRDATSSRRGVPYYERTWRRRSPVFASASRRTTTSTASPTRWPRRPRRPARGSRAWRAVVTQVRLPDPQPLVDVSNVISRSESATIHSRVLRDRPHELQPAVRARLTRAFTSRLTTISQALRLRGRFTRRSCARYSAEVDLLVLPVIPEPAPALEAVKAGTADEIVRGWAGSRASRGRSYGLGLPALALPCGALSRQPAARAADRRTSPFDEATVLRLGHAYQRG